MKLGVHNDQLSDSLSLADLVFVYRPENFPPDFDRALEASGDKVQIYGDYDQLVSGLSAVLRPGDRLVFMSNGSFGAARQKLTMELQKKRIALSD
jgi:UDP-N-acetylmuramate: L-alanyl-gamma-D-glutamyl-meso-diaminopimelate ligase